MKKSKQMKLKKPPKLAKNDANSVASPASATKENRESTSETTPGDESRDVEEAVTESEDTVEDTEPDDDLPLSDISGSPASQENIQASTSQGLRVMAKGLNAIADALGAGKEAQFTEESPAMAIQPLIDASILNADKATDYIPLDNACGCSCRFSESTPGGQNDNPCVHQRRRDSKVVVTLEDLSEPPADRVPQKNAFAPVMGNRELNMEEYVADRTAQRCECPTAADNRELVLDVVVESPIYMDGNVKFVQSKQDVVGKNADMQQSKGRHLRNSSADTMARQKPGRDMSAAQHQKKAAVARSTKMSRKKAQIEGNKREGFLAPSAIDTVKSEAKENEEGGQDMENLPEQGFPMGDIYEKIEDLPRPQGEHRAAAAPDQQPAPLETDTEVRYKAIGGVTIALLLMVILVVAAVIADVYLSGKDSTHESSPKTSPATASAARIGSENRSARIFIFMSEEESKTRDVAILDVNDEI